MSWLVGVSPDSSVFQIISIPKHKLRMWVCVDMCTWFHVYPCDDGSPQVKLFLPQINNAGLGLRLDLSLGKYRKAELLFVFLFVCLTSLWENPPPWCLLKSCEKVHSCQASLTLPSHTVSDRFLNLKYPDTLRLQQDSTLITTLKWPQRKPMQSSTTADLPEKSSDEVGRHLKWV